MHYPEIGRKRCKRVVGYLGPRSRNRRNERRFPGVGKTHKADVGNQLQLEFQVVLLPGLAVLRETRCPVSRTHEMGVSLPAPPPFGRYPPLGWFCQVGKCLTCLRVFRLSANRHLQDKILTASSPLVLAGPVSTGLGLEKVSISKVKQAVLSLRGLQHDAAALTAVAPIRTAPGHVLLAPETHAAVPAFACHYRDCHFVDEFHLISIKMQLPSHL